MTGRTIAVIQARMASTRFPGKSLAMLYGKPMLQWVIEAVRDVVRTVVVATTEGREDNDISELADTLGVDVYRKGLKPLMLYDWYLAIGREYKATAMLRICGDQPLLSRGICYAVSRGATTRDYITAAFGGKVSAVTEYGIGCESFRTDALVRKSPMKDKHMEHVTTAFYLNPKTTRILRFNVEELDGARFRGTVDTRQDLQRIEQRIEAYGRFPVTLEEVIECMCT